MGTSFLVSSLFGGGVSRTFVSNFNILNIEISDLVFIQSCYLVNNDQLLITLLYSLVYHYYNVFSFPFPPWNRGDFGSKNYQLEEMLPGEDGGHARTYYCYCMQIQYSVVVTSVLIGICGVGRPPCEVPPSFTMFMVHLPLVN